jgi:hypothetical protein
MTARQETAAHEARCDRVHQELAQRIALLRRERRVQAAHLRQTRSRLDLIRSK